MTLYFFSRAAEALKRILQEAPPQTDPIDHPSIAAMSLAELADLPLGPEPTARSSAPRESVIRDRAA